LAFTDKIKLIIELVADGANKQLDTLKGKLGDADDATGKFKTGASSAFETVKAHAGQLALAGGAALAAFGVKAVTAFQDTALEAGKLADSSGLAVDAASRWIAVGDDIGVGAETMATGFNKLNVEIGKANPLLTELGITTQRNKEGQVDANATMLHAIDVIRGIEDPTKKAEAAQAAFGRGWKEMGELINMGSAEIVDGMAKVSSQQVIDDKELAKAREFREKLDALVDKFKDVALEIGGQLAPALSDLMPLFETLGDGAVFVAKGVGQLTGAFDSVLEGAYDIGASFGRLINDTDMTVETLHNAERAASEMFAGLASGVSTLDGFNAKMDAANVTFETRNLLTQKFIELNPQESEAYKEKAEITAMYTERLRGATGALDDTAESTSDLTRENDLLADAIKQTEDRYSDLKGELSDEEAFHNAQGMWDDLKQSAVDAYTAASENADDAAQKAFDHQGAVIDAKQAVVELGEKYADLPESEVTAIVALIDEGSLEEAERRFNILTRNRQMQVSIATHGGVGFGSGARHTGGPVGASQDPNVQAGEMFVRDGPMSQAGRVYPKSQIDRLGDTAGGGDVYNLTLHNHVRPLTADDLSTAIRRLRLQR